MQTSLSALIDQTFLKFLLSCKIALENNEQQNIKRIFRGCLFETAAICVLCCYWEKFSSSRNDLDGP